MRERTRAVAASPAVYLVDDDAGGRASGRHNAVVEERKQGLHLLAAHAGNLVDGL